MINTINKKELNLSGIYKITNTVDNRLYIGSALVLRKRFNIHKYQLVHYKHHSTKLQNFVIKYGIETLKFELIELCSSELLILTEQKWLDYYQSCEFGFNECPNAYSRLGTRLSEETKAKISAAQKGRKHSEETRIKMSAILEGNSRSKGIIASEETRAKQSAVRKGRKHSEETRAKISAAQKGKIVSEETKAKISATQILRRLRESETI